MTILAKLIPTTRCFIIGLILGCPIVVSMAQDRPSVGRVLFVGNSYTGGIKAAMLAMARQQRLDGRFDFIHPGGKTLTWHLENGTADKIRRGDYDIVVLQEQSQTPAYPGLQENFWKASKELSAITRDAGAIPLLYQTWGRRDGDMQNAHVAPTFNVMQDLLTASYAKAAVAAKAEVVPVGEVWRAIRENDVELARRMYVADGSHPSAVGAYVTALTFTCQLTGRKPATIPAPRGLPISPLELKTIRTAVNSQLMLEE